MSLLPDDDVGGTLLPPDDEEDIPMFIDDGSGGPDVYEEKRRKVIPKYKNLMPKKVFLNVAAPVAIVMDLLFGYIIYTFLKDAGLVITDLNSWKNIGAILLNLVGNTRDFIMVIILSLILFMVNSIWDVSRKKVSKCPVCQKTNLRNYHVCVKCDYIFMSRDIINREILSVKLNNLDYNPEQVRQEFLDRRLADLDAAYIKKILEKNHFL
ncbi:MAG: hypothetical protein ACTSUE_21220 [Promethearchaeota archaeon]